MISLSHWGMFDEPARPATYQDAAQILADLEQGARCRCINWKPGYCCVVQRRRAFLDGQ